MKRKPPCTPHSVHKSRRLERVVQELSKPQSLEPLDEAVRQRIAALAPRAWTRPWFEQVIEACIGRNKLLAWDVDTVIDRKAVSTVTVHLTFWPDVVNTMYADHLAHVFELECWPYKPAGTLFRVRVHKAPTS